MKNFLGLVVFPDPLKSQSMAKDLQTRLQWGQPALTILDVREHDSFNSGRIRGAVSMPLPSLPNQAVANFESERDLYVYGVSDQETATAAELLRRAGFAHVAELKGGFSAWKGAGYPVEG